ncbi:hypothetical protein [Leptolyngbya sp. FACHB-16]|uniref:hypothetical protein n=1 Tax=unclassified Leptolyngbya TaxID=2650499 RepID=UPI00168A1211|nr:hypothetical protein [Leptolyngbya sp. FACHB-16]MBD2156283.1 hypothetical protein [Leptolyngbya sp. FACHB-16]
MKRQFSVYLTDDLDRAVRVYAAAHRLQLSEVAIEAFTQYLEAQKKQQQEATPIAS